jgi:hypothetical protein
MRSGPSEDVSGVMHPPAMRIIQRLQNMAGAALREYALMIKSLAALVNISSRESAGMSRATNSDFPCHRLSFRIRCEL